MKHSILKSVFILFCLIFIPTGVLNAHPHVFIEQNLKIIFDEKGVAGINVHWKFDDMFSNMILEDYDLNKNSTLEKSEVLSIREKAFSYIAEFDYFIYIKINNRPFKVQYVTDFFAELEQGRLVYDFLIPCHVSASSNFKKITIASYDPNYYSAVYFSEQEPYTLVHHNGFEIEADIKRDRSISIYYDMINPWSLFLDFKLRQ